MRLKRRYTADSRNAARVGVGLVDFFYLFFYYGQCQVSFQKFKKLTFDKPLRSKCVSKCHGRIRMGEAISHVISNFCLNICFFKFFKWDLICLKFWKKKIVGVEVLLRVLELLETCRSTKIFFAHCTYIRKLVQNPLVPFSPVVQSAAPKVL